MSDILKFGPEKDIEQDISAIDKSSQANIKDIFHAITELVTNADDAYVDMEALSAHAPQTIKIGTIRALYGKDFILVTDEAGGMNEEALKCALRFSGETSGFHKEQRFTRGLFGQGLKEAIVALGTGLVLTGQGATLRGARLRQTKKVSYIDPIQTAIRTESGATKNFMREKMREALVEFVVSVLPQKEVCLPLSEFLTTFTCATRGTTVVISLENPRFKVAKFETMRDRIQTKPHLRYILWDEQRQVELFYLDGKKPFNQDGRDTYIKTEILAVSPVKGKVVHSDSFFVGHKVRGKVVKIEIKEAQNQLTKDAAGIFFTYFGRVTLDHEVWLEELGDATMYFTGTADVTEYLVPELKAKSYRLLLPTRQGLDWREPENRCVKERVQEILRPLLVKKQQQLEGEKRPLAKDVRENLKRVITVMNQIFAELESELDPKEVTGAEIYRNEMFIKPEVVTLKPGVPRPMGVYVPTSLCEEKPEKVSIVCNNSLFTVDYECDLEAHNKYPDRFWYGKFRIYSHTQGEKGEKGIVTAIFMEHRASATCIVGEPGHKPKPGRLEPSKPRRRGVFTSIEPDKSPTPSQRYWFDKDTGVLRIYVKFPRTGEYLGQNFERATGNKATREGALLFAELVCDAIARVHVIERIESSHRREEGVAVDDSAYSFMGGCDEIKKQYLDRIYDTLIGSASYRKEENHALLDEPPS